jgi:hypothetical protein
MRELGSPHGPGILKLFSLLLKQFSTQSCEILRRILYKMYIFKYFYVL